MDNKIQYLNTDLDLRSKADLTPLVRAFDAARMTEMNLTRGDDGVWYATVEMPNKDEPEPNIADMLAVIESLARPLRRIWNACTLREFNIGYDCGAEPWSFNQGLSAALLKRIVAVGASLRLTLYPDRSESGSARPAAKACAPDLKPFAKSKRSTRAAASASRSRSAATSARRARPPSKASPKKRRSPRAARP